MPHLDAGALKRDPEGLAFLRSVTAPSSGDAGLFPPVGPTPQREGRTDELRPSRLAGEIGGGRDRAWARGMGW
jgi:hypothetical protein